MFTALSIQFKIAIFLLIGLIAGYVWYDVIVKPRNKIEELERTIEVQREIPTIIVNKINADDAKKTTKEIKDVKTDDNITFHDTGVIFF